MPDAVCKNAAAPPIPRDAARTRSIRRILPSCKHLQRIVTPPHRSSSTDRCTTMQQRAARTRRPPAWHLHAISPGGGERVDEGEMMATTTELDLQARRTTTYRDVRTWYAPGRVETTLRVAKPDP